ncbi:hypothetical protein WJX77_012430 [Trebouxia sp. C0004]
MTTEKPDVTQIGVANPSADAKLAEILKEYKDVFPVELPSELPPERTVFHTIPLKEGAVPPPRKMYRLSGPEKQEGAQVFSSMDLQSAYYQVKLKPEDVPKTAFTTPRGLYEYTVLCFV